MQFEMKISAVSNGNTIGLAWEKWEAVTLSTVTALRLELPGLWWLTNDGLENVYPRSLEFSVS